MSDYGFIDKLTKKKKNTQHTPISSEHSFMIDGLPKTGLESLNTALCLL